jgi:CBS domain-containing protein
MNAATPSVVAALRSQLQPHAPFGQMPAEELDQLIGAAQIAYFEPGQVILAPGGEPEYCFLIKQGLVRGERPDGSGVPAATWELSQGEMFPLGALLAHRAATSVYRAVGDVFCLLLPRPAFERLLERSLVFRDFCTRRLASLLDLSRQQVQAAYVAETASQQAMDTPLRELVRREPVTCAQETPIRDALAAMYAVRVGSIIIVDNLQQPLGIFTRTDLVGKVILPGRPLTDPVFTVMSSPVRRLPAGAPAGDAALMMVEHGIQHVVLTDGDRLSGVVSERDLFGLQRISLRQASRTIRHASTRDSLVRAAGDIRALSHGLVAQGVSAAQLTRFVSSLNDQLTVRALELLLDQHDLAGVRWCWIAMGSEGRQEQTISTDQDNGIIFSVSQRDDVEATRARLLRFGQAMNLWLRDCGFPLCRGGIMAGNRKWCLTLDEWRQVFTGWIDRGDPEALLDASIFFDFRPLAGHEPLAYQLRHAVVERAHGNRRFLKQMADNLLRNRPPLNWFGRLTEDDDGTIDLKLHGTMPFVDAARLLALAAGVPATATADRLRGAAPLLHLGDATVQAWIDAFNFVQMLRLRAQHALGESASTAHDRAANRIDPETLSEVDQRILKEAFRQARKLQQRVAVDFAG